MDVRLLSSDGCPTGRETDERLRQAMAGAGATIVHRTRVSTPEGADRLPSRGSPTWLVDGRDPFADPSAPVGPSCRAYRTPDALRCSPSVEQLVQVLT